jgi:peptidoglycan/LPS O-acetylase OafA/YrhL
MAGVVVYRKSQAWHIPKPVAAALFVTSAIMLALSPSIRPIISLQLMGQEIAGRYVDAFAFVLNLVAARRLLDGNTPLAPTVGKTIKWIASTTFVLYLFHRPLIQLFSYIGPPDPGSWGRRVLVIGVTLVIVALATPLCDRFQKYLRAVCLRWLTPETAKHRAPQLAVVDDPLDAQFDARKVADG